MKRITLSQRSRLHRTLLVLLSLIVVMTVTALKETEFTNLEQEPPSFEKARDIEGVYSQTAFTYQGQLKEEGMPANGTYDLQFSLYTAQAGGDERGFIVYEDIDLTNGLFSLVLDFGRADLDGHESWLEIAIRPGNDTNSYAVLSPRQKLSPTPYAIFAQTEQWNVIGVPIGYPDPIERAGELLEYEAPLEGELDTGTESQNAALQNTSGWVDSGSVVRLITSTDRVGIGTSSPGTQLHVRASEPRIVTESTRGRWARLGAGFSGAALTFGQNGNLDIESRSNFVEGSRSGRGVRIMGQTGNVGIGTAGPATKLHINGGSDASLNNGSGYLLIGSETSANIVMDDNEIIARANGKPSKLFLNKDSNNVVVSVLEITGGSDLAEPFEVFDAERIRPGMVVSIDPLHPGQLRVTDESYDRTVAGIISGANGIKPGLTMRQDSTETDGSFLVALSGRVYCWADASNGPIVPGDLLTSSGTQGHAMKVIDPGQGTGSHHREGHDGAEARPRSDLGSRVTPVTQTG